MLVLASFILSKIIRKKVAHHAMEPLEPSEAKRTHAFCPAPALTTFPVCVSFQSSK